MKVKKFYSILAGAAAASLLLAGCATGGSTGETHANSDSTAKKEAKSAQAFTPVREAGACPAKMDMPNKKVVYTTFTILADIADNIGCDMVEIRSITKPDVEIHDYEPTPKDVEEVSKASLILDNGLGLERWFEKFVSEVKVKHVVASNGVTPINITEDEDAGKPNPHSWMSTDNVKKYVDNIVQAFSEIEPAHAAMFKTNGEYYKGQLDKIHTQLHDKLSALPDGAKALVTCEGAFSYLAKDAGLKEQYLWAVNSASEEDGGSPQQIQKVIDFVKENKVPAIFCESTVEEKGHKQVLQETGAKEGGVLYVDSLSKADGPTPTYLKLMQYDADTIIKGLTGKN